MIHVKLPAIPVPLFHILRIGNLWALTMGAPSTPHPLETSLREVAEVLPLGLL